MQYIPIFRIYQGAATHNPLIRSSTSTPTAGAERDQRIGAGQRNFALNNQSYRVPLAPLNRYPDAFDANRSVAPCVSVLCGHLG